MPTFCRHNRFIQNCPVCSPPSSSLGGPGQRIAAGRGGTGSARPASARGATRRGVAGRVRVRQAAQLVDDGFRTALAPGLRSSVDAQRLADELAFSCARLVELAVAPPGVYAEVATGYDVEAALEVALAIALLCPLEQESDPWPAIRAAAAVVTKGGSLAEVEDWRVGPRGTADPAAAMRALDAYRAWIARSGSALVAFTGDASWTPERRFARVYERLALPGLRREGRFDLLVTLGRLGQVQLRAGSLGLGGDDAATVAAKRLLGIGDPLLLERRAATLAQATGVPLDALDLALHNWGTPERRATMGASVEADPQVSDAVGRALGLVG